MANDLDLRIAPPGAKPTAETLARRARDAEERLDAERLLHFARIYDTAMDAPAPEIFNDMVQWAYARQAAQAEFARFARELLRKRGTL